MLNQVNTVCVKNLLSKDQNVGGKVVTETGFVPGTSRLHKSPVLTSQTSTTIINGRFKLIISLKGGSMQKKFF